jgi:membrane protein DedA with SNARE-associated domain
VTDPQLPGIFAKLAPTLDHYGYLAVGGFVLVEDFGIPVPGETILIAAAVYAGAGKLNILVVALIGFVAAILGDNIGYLIGRVGGRPLIERFGRFIFLTPERLDKAEAFFTRHGGKVVTIARFVEGLRQANGIIAGITGMHWLRFLAFNALGAALWVGLWVSVGDLAGSHLQAIYDAVTRYSLIAVAVAIVVLILLVLRHRRRRARPAPATR